MVCLFLQHVFKRGAGCCIGGRESVVRRKSEGEGELIVTLRCESGLMADDVMPVQMLSVGCSMRGGKGMSPEGGVQAPSWDDAQLLGAFGRVVSKPELLVGELTLDSDLVAQRARMKLRLTVEVVRSGAEKEVRAIALRVRVCPTNESTICVGGPGLEDMYVEFHDLHARVSKEDVTGVGENSKKTESKEVVVQKCLSESWGSASAEWTAQASLGGCGGRDQGSGSDGESARSDRTLGTEASVRSQKRKPTDDSMVQWRREEKRQRRIVPKAVPKDVAKAVPRAIPVLRPSGVGHSRPAPGPAKVAAQSAKDSVCVVLVD